MNAPKLFFLKALNHLIDAIDALAIIAIIAVLGPPLIMRFQPKTMVGVIAPVRIVVESFTTPLAAWLRARLHQPRGASDSTPFVIAAILAVVVIVCRVAAHNLRVYILTLKELQKVAEAEEAARKANTASKLAAIEAASGTQREQVLEVYAQAKRILDGQKRTLSFLAVDVVNSTGMKQGEDPVLAERDFRQYRKLVETVIASHGFLKAAWTPDGVMICFPATTAAVAAAQDLLRGLRKFNAGTKSIKADFKVRCGINSGEVLYDAAVKMEEMSDGAIDLAGHMQKYAQPDTIYAARSLVAALGEGSGFRAIDAKVDGLEVSAWSA
jgi:class 3 adenylate cyclase